MKHALTIWLLIAAPCLAGPVESSYRVSITTGNVTDAGSGTGISANCVVTNSHVVSNRLQPRVSLRNHAGQTTLGVCVLADPACDLALIYVAKGGIEWAPLGTDPQPGERLSLYGWGGQGVLTRKTGTRITGRSWMDGTFTVPVIECSMQSVSGDSGGGLFNERGELCAVNWGSDGHAHTVGVSNVLRVAQVYETQCQGGRCVLPPPGTRRTYQGPPPTYAPQALVPVQPRIITPVQPACPCDPNAIASIRADIANIQIILKRMQETPPGAPPEPPKRESQSPAAPACACKPGKDCACDPEALTAAIIAKLPAGPAGLKGATGPAGPPAVVDYEAIVAKVLARMPLGARGPMGPPGPVSPVDYDLIVERVLARIPKQPAYFSIQKVPE